MSFRNHFFNDLLYLLLFNLKQIKLFLELNLKIFQFPGLYVFMLSFSVYPVMMILHYVLYNFIMGKTLIGLTQNIPKWSLLFTSLNLGILIYSALPALIAIISFFFWWFMQTGDSPWWDKAIGAFSIVSFLYSLSRAILWNVRPIYIL